MDLVFSFIAIAEAAAKQQAQLLKAAENSELQQRLEPATACNGEDRSMERDSLPRTKLYSCSATSLSCVDGTDAIAV